MMDPARSRSTKAWMAGLVLMAGILFVLHLQSAITDEVFFNGDGGLKLLQTKQFASGDLHLDLRLPAEPWVQEAWREGAYPFHPPFAYQRGDRFYSAFPIFLPLLSSPFYRLMGLRGLYLIPVAALLLLWFGFLALCRRLELGPWATSIALVTLIFASPLTLYSAMYWEHTLAVALAFAGLAAVLSPPAADDSKWRLGRGGVLTGLAVWLRPELLLFAALLVALVMLEGRRRPGFPHGRPFILSVVVTAVLSWGANLAISGHPLGFHSWQVLYGPGGMSRFAGYIELQGILTTKLLFYVPAVLFPFLYFVISLRGLKRAWSGPIVRLAGLGLGYLLAIPLMVPNGGGRQWGPRYLLILVPVIALFVGIALKRMNGLRPRLAMYAGFAALLVIVAIGIQRNMLEGGMRVRQDYLGRVLPALTYVREHPARFVAVSRQWISQDLAAAMGEKVFFRTPTFADLGRLASRLVRHDAHQFLYLNMPGEPAPRGLDFEEGGRVWSIAFSRVGQAGQYRIFSCSILPAPVSPTPS